MKYLIDKNYNVITTADDEYEFMIQATATDFPGSVVMDHVPKKPIPTDQPQSTGTQTL
jgi:hypothetical protein